MPSRARERSAKTPIKVAVIGGGCAGVAAAWHLARQQGYEIHVFERNPYLGGKGASTRDESGRILEHGLHVWLGFYENAFKLMRECYEQLSTTPDAEKLVHQSFDDAFFPEPQVGVGLGGAASAWEAWTALLPPTKGAPGLPFDDETNPFTLPSYIARCISLVRALMLSVAGASDNNSGTDRTEAHGRSSLDETVELDLSFDPARSPRVVIDALAQRLRQGSLVSAALLLQALTIFEDWLRGVNFARGIAASATELVEAIAAQLRRRLREIVSIDPRLRSKTEVIDIVMTIAVGLYSDRVLFSKNGLDAINDIDYREWLRKHGLTREAERSAFLTGIYDLVFAYRDGDRTQPALAAGVALRGALRMFFTYRGAMFWRMRSGMGEAVFAPLFRVLRRPADQAFPSGGIRFHLGCRLTSMSFDFEGEGVATAARVRRLRFRRIFEEAAEPLDSNGCWPDNPPPSTDESFDWQADKDFDVVVFAAGIAPFADACKDSGFFKRMPARWETMRRRVATVATRSAQVWLGTTLRGTGWDRGSLLLTALGAPFDTWADMSHTLAIEAAWRRNHQPPIADGDQAQSVAYFCGVRPDAGKGEPAGERARADLGAMLRGEAAQEQAAWIRSAWPALFDAKKNRTALDHAVGGQTRKQRLEHQYVRDNTEGSERYTLSLPGSVSARISPLDRSISNLTLVGDWTACGLDAGCIEAAVMSGMLAAHAVSGGAPALDDIVGFHHP